eukprot:TRINITY_DN16017_c0_g1_i1.p1 TRINITY_DN16017_c0_g1~~TRINITY_DN16017_c0_g1_i1.p1  ORF type:complete len:582 (+),score=153.05 TRINITY_DN16017_c0_g1_i1:78-1748(+)
MRTFLAVAAVLLAERAAAAGQHFVAATPAPTPAALFMCSQEGGCVEAKPGTPGAMTKDECQRTCKVGPTPTPGVPPTPPPAAVYVCNDTSKSCHSATPGTPGSSSKEVCERTCGQGPTPPPPPAADVYACNVSSFQCHVAAPGSPGASSKEVCQQYCKPSPPGPPSDHYECDTVIGKCWAAPAGTGPSKGDCELNCTRAPVPPPTPPPGPPSPPAPVPPGEGYTCDMYKSWQCIKGGDDPLGACELKCIKPNPVYICNNDTGNCTEVPPFTPGSTDRITCMNKCAGGPSTPVPPMPTVYGCNKTTFQCNPVAPYTPGSGPLDLCTDKCVNPGPTPPAPQRNCSGTLELLFVIDGSGSINATNWRFDLDYVGTIASHFAFGCGSSEHPDVKMGIIQFSTQTKVEQQLTCSKSAFFASLTTMEEMGAYTYTGDALAAAAKIFSGPAQAGSERALVMITDGVPCTAKTVQTCDPPAASGVAPTPDPTQAAEARKEAQDMKARGVRILSIAVGNFEGKGIQFIDDISSAPASKYVFNPSSWDKMPALLNKILNDICPPKP